MLDTVIEARKAQIVPGFEVKRILPFQLRRMAGPFIFMDHGGPVSIPTPTASNLDVLPHPHIGLSTVSYLFSGTYGLNSHVSTTSPMFYLHVVLDQGARFGPPPGALS